MNQTKLSSIVRAICACVVGYLLVMYRTEMVQWLTIAIGALFFVSGLVSVATYYMEKRRADRLSERLATMAGLRDGADAPQDREDITRAMAPSFPIVGLGSMILGIILAAMPATFVTGVMYALAAILILGALNQYYNLASIRRISRVPFLFWLFPTVILITGIFILIKPMEMSALPFRILGWCLILYGIVECINGIKIYKAKKAFAESQRHIGNIEDIEEAEIVE